jgi:VIT1/CCC1 family predicted Fe2+/Mn2+ transporter
MPLGTVLIAPREWLIVGVIIFSVLLLALLGALGARIGGAPTTKAALRVAVWDAIAMGLIARVGAMFGAVV